MITVLTPVSVCVMFRGPLVACQGIAPRKRSVLRSDLHDTCRLCSTAVLLSEPWSRSIGKYR